MVDKKNKKVFFAESTSKDLSDHSFSLSTLVTVAEKLQINRNKYKIVLLLCADWSRAITNGPRFNTDTDDDLTLSELKKQEKISFIKEMEVIIARVCYYPNKEKCSI